MKLSKIPEIRRVNPDTEWDEEYWDGFVEDYSETKRKQKRRESRREKLHYALIALESAVMTLLRRRARRQKKGWDALRRRITSNGVPSLIFILAALHIALDRSRIEKGTVWLARN